MDKTDRHTIEISAVLEMAPESLQAIVGNGKQLAGQDEKGRFKIDAAELANRVISRFLMEKDFQSYAEDIGNYSFFFKGTDGQPENHQPENQ